MGHRKGSIESCLLIHSCVPWIWSLQNNDVQIEDKFTEEFKDSVKLQTESKLVDKFRKWIIECKDKSQGDHFFSSDVAMGTIF